MQKSGRKINKTIEKQIFEMAYQVLADCKDPKEVAEVVKDFLSEAEALAMVKRLAIAVYLDKGRSYEDIKNHLKVSSATIASVAEQVGNPGFQKAINMVKAEEWANEWSGKIGNLMGVLKKK